MIGDIYEYKHVYDKNQRTSDFVIVIAVDDYSVYLLFLDDLEMSGMIMQTHFTFHKFYKKVS